MGLPRNAVLLIPFLALLGLACGDSSKPARKASDAVSAAVASRHPISVYEIRSLRDRGLVDPVGDLIASLMATPTVIPHEGLHGGRMGFYHAKDIYVLDGRTVFARFDDGHIVGSGVFEFTVLPDSTVNWRVVSSHIDESD